MVPGIFSSQLEICLRAALTSKHMLESVDPVIHGMHAVKQYTSEPLDVNSPYLFDTVPSVNVSANF